MPRKTVWSFQSEGWAVNGHLAFCDDGQQLTEGDDNLGASQRGTSAEAGSSANSVVAHCR
jgi:hypothetical protein